MAQKVFTVIGATGQQGGSFIQWVLSDNKLSKEFKIRDVTRNASKAKLPPSVEVVESNVDDVESLKRAFKGCDVVFGMTNYWAVMNRDVEIQQGKNIADAVKAADRTL
jgi:uncharacterized protein YbjT (DUF2867 family)